MKFMRSTIAKMRAKQIDDPRMMYNGVLIIGPRPVNQFLSRMMLITPLEIV